MSQRRWPLLAIVATTACAFAHGQRYASFTTPTPLPAGDVLVLGFVGGRQSWDSDTEAVRRLAVKLRRRALPHLHVETVENKKRALALELIQRAFDRDRDGALGEDERAATQLILYGQSFGGAAVVKLARQLDARRVPVLLTVQVDSVGRGDAVIPANVVRAANLFQASGLVIKGEPEIRAADPSRTRIVGNFEFDYDDSDIDLSEVPWHKQIFRRAHSRMNLDPEVWSLVEELLVDEVERVSATTTTDP